MLYGFSGVILQGAIVTLELALSSVVLSVQQQSCRKAGQWGLFSKGTQR